MLVKANLVMQENVKKPKCAQAGCKVHPCFNYPGERSGLFCKAHHATGMVSTTVLLAAPVRWQSPCEIKTLVIANGQGW